MASFNYETGQYKRVKKALLCTTAIGFGIVLMICVPVYIFAPGIVSLLQKADIVVDFAAPALRYAAIGSLFLPVSTPINMVYQSIQKAWTASFLSLLRSGLIFIPVLLLTTSIWGLTGIQISQPLADAVTGLISIPFFIRFIKTTPSGQQPITGNDGETKNKRKGE